MDWIFPLGIVVALLSVLWAAQEVGILEMRRSMERNGSDEGASAGPIEGAVFSILGLLLAFSFSVSEGRFDNRRQLAVQEANCIGTALLRVELLPSDMQTPMKDYFKEYLSARIEFNRGLSGHGDREGALAKTQELQGRMWGLASRAPGSTGGAMTPVQALLLPALNDMFDIATTRKVATETRLPLVTQGLLVVISILSAYLAGKSGGLQRGRLVIFRFIYPLVIALTLMVIFDLDNPRLGIIRVDFADQPLLDLQRSAFSPS